MRRNHASVVCMHITYYCCSCIRSSHTHNSWEPEPAQIRQAANRGAQLRGKSRTDKLLQCLWTLIGVKYSCRVRKPFSKQHVGIKATAAYATRIRAEQLCRNN